MKNSMSYSSTSERAKAQKQRVAGTTVVLPTGLYKKSTNHTAWNQTETPRHLQLKDLRRFVIFNTRGTLVPEAWKLLGTLLDEGAFKSIVRLKRVTSPNRLPRIDMWVKEELALHLVRAINARSKTRNLDIVTAFGNLYRKGQSRRPLAAWRVVPWQPFQDRKPKIYNVEESPRGASNSFMTLNVNGLQKKYWEVLDALLKQRVAVACLQETLVSRTAYPPVMEGYTCYTQPWEDGFRGLAVLVDNRCSSYEVPHRLGKGLIHVRVSGLQGIVGPVNVFGLYLPSGGNYRSNRTRFIKDALELASRQLDEPNGSKVILLGDWNTAPERVDKLVAERELRISRVKPRGSGMTRFSTLTGPKSIDHILASSDLQHLIRRPRVVRRVALSDHRPVVSVIRSSSTGPLTEKRPSYRYDAGMIRKNSKAIVSDNRWEALADHEGTATPTELAEEFNSAFAEVTEGLGIRTKITDRGIKYPASLKELLKRKKRYDKEWTTLAERGEEVPEILEVKRKRAAQKYRKARREWTAKQRSNFYNKVAADAIAGDTKSVWRRLTSTVGNKIHKNSKVRTSAFHPATDERTNELITDLPGVVNVHADHYERLATFNGDGHRDKWEEWMQLGPNDMHEELEGINEPLNFREVLLAIRRMNRNTATGVDEVHINVLKALVPEEGWAEFLAKNPDFTRADWSRKDLKASELPVAPHTKLGKALMKVLNATWEKECVPDSWKRVDIVSLLKPGAQKPENVDEYRGISLISVAEKVLLQIMTERLYTAVEKADILATEQAGFRRREEAMAQVIAVADIVRRRKLAGKSTIGVFVDFKKAYDRVPHGALIHALAKSGVRGKFLNLVNHIYETSEMSVKIDGVNSRSFRMYRGVRQGCPLSPLLFLLFINPILEESVPKGVEVPGLGWRTSRGAMYADDLLCLVENKEQAQQVVTGLDNWCKKWGMELGLPKCGVMMWPWGPSAPSLQNETFRTASGEVPVVTEYKYLGVWLDQTLGDHRSGTSKWGPSLELENSKRRAAEGLKAAHALRPILTDRHCPISLKVLLIHNLIVPLMAYGAEWTGFRQTHAEPLQRVVNMAIRWAVGVSAKSNTYDFMTLTYELRIPTMETEMAGRRTRLHAKLKTSEEDKKLKTQIQVLMDNKDIPGVNKRLYSWPRSGQGWLDSLPKEKSWPRAEKKLFGLHTSHRISDEQVLCSVEGTYGYWEPVWKQKELDRIKRLRIWLEKYRGWSWTWRPENNFWYEGDYFTAPSDAEFERVFPGGQQMDTTQLTSWVGKKIADALEWPDTHLETLVRPVRNQKPLPLRPWAMRGQIYEMHTRSNGFKSEYIEGILEIASGYDAEGVPTKQKKERRTFKKGTRIPITLDLLAEWGELQREGMSAKGDLEVTTMVHNTRTRLLERQFETCRTEGFRWYNAWGFGATRDYIRHAGTQPKLAEGTRWLTSIRCRAFPRVGEAIAKAKYSGKPCGLVPGKCPLCSESVDNGWEWAHLLVKCQDQTCREERTKWFGPMISQMEEVICMGESLTTLPLNAGVSDWTRPRLGAVAIYLVGGVVNNGFDNSIHLGFGQLPISVHLNGDNYGMLYVRTASFLQTVAPLYVAHLGGALEQGLDFDSEGLQVAEIGGPPHGGVC